MYFVLFFQINKYKPSTKVVNSSGRSFSLAMALSHEFLIIFNYILFFKKKKKNQWTFDMKLI